MKPWRMTMAMAVALFASASWAGEVREERFGCDPDAKVSVENVAGKVTVRSWDRPEIEFRIKVGDDVERLEFSRSSSHPGVEVVLPNRTRGRSDSECDIEIACPPGVSLDVECISADVDVQGIRGGVEVQTVSGGVVIEDAGEDVEVETVSGGIRVAGDMNEVLLSTTSGSIAASGSAETLDGESVSGGFEVAIDADEVRLHTTSGKIIVAGEIASIDAESISGRIEIGEIHQEADVASMSGSIRMKGVMPGDVRVESFSGSVDYSGGLRAGGRLEMTSKSGAVSVALPVNIEATFDLATRSGGIHNDLGVGPKPTGRTGPGKVLDFETGDGRSQIILESASGSVRINGLPPMVESTRDRELPLLEAPKFPGE